MYASGVCGTIISGFGWLTARVPTERIFLNSQKNTARANLAVTTRVCAMSRDLLSQPVKMDHEDFDSLLNSMGTSLPGESFLDGLSMFDLFTPGPLAGDMFGGTNRNKWTDDFEESFASLDLGFE